MTYLDVVFRYVNQPTEREARAMDSVREVYGILMIQFDEKEKTVRVRYDASRLNEDMVAGLLRRTGLDLGEKLVLA
jgi:hypothetical protein